MYLYKTKVLTVWNVKRDVADNPFDNEVEVDGEWEETNIIPANSTL